MKIYALTTMKGFELDETDGQDAFTHMEMRDFAEEHGDFCSLSVMNIT